MAKRLSKALRGKRRWVGVEVDPSFDSKTKVEQSLQRLSSGLGDVRLRLFDCILAEEREHKTTGNSGMEDISSQGGLAIIEVPLHAYSDLRDLLEDEEARDSHGLRSLTASGKIRLVRQRLGLPKPPRR